MELVSFFSCVHVHVCMYVCVCVCVSPQVCGLSYLGMLAKQEVTSCAVHIIGTEQIVKFHLAKEREL